MVRITRSILSLTVCLVPLLAACSSVEGAESSPTPIAAAQHELTVEATLDLLTGPILVGASGAAGSPCRSPTFQRWVNVIQVSDPVDNSTLATGRFPKKGVWSGPSKQVGSCTWTVSFHVNDVDTYETKIGPLTKVYARDTLAAKDWTVIVRS